MKDSQESIRLRPLGGLGEFGRNALLLESAEATLLIDAGVRFPEAEHLGVDQLAPNFEQGIGDRRLDALLLTHGHEDHIGAIPALLIWRQRQLLPALPIYGSPFTLGLVRRRLDEWDLMDEAQLFAVDPTPENRFVFGDISVEFVGVNHSIPGACALVLDTPAGRLVHSGDWRIDPNPVAQDYINLPRLTELGREGVRLLLSDSTNGDRPGSTGSESEVAEALFDLLDVAPGRVLITLFSSNLSRVQSILEAAHQTDRVVAVVGRSLENNIGLARDLGVLRMPADDLLLSVNALKGYSAHEQVLIVGGSQGEPHSNLTRLARGEHGTLQIQKDDWVVYSNRIIPGNERKIAQVIDQLHRLGAEVIQPSQRQPLHTSGHAHSDEMRLLLRLVDPELHLPVHGGHRQLELHRRLASKLGYSSHIFTAGDEIELDSSGLHVVGNFDAHPVYLAGNHDAIIDESLLQERRRIGHNGLIFASMALDEAGELLGAPIVEILGITAKPEDLEIDLIELIETLVPGERAPFAQLSLSETLRRALRRHVRKRYGRKPTVNICIHRP